MTAADRRRARAARGPRRAADGPPPRPAVDLAVRIGPMRLPNPVLVASGTFGYGDEYRHVVPPAQLGAVVTKTVTVRPRAGNPPQRIAETAGGMLNSIGLENVGLAAFRAEKLPRLRALGARIVASIGGETPHELERMMEALGGEPGVDGFEINFSCPNVAKGGARYWAVPRRLERTVARLRRHTRACLIAKLSPDVTSVPELARACEQGGADAVTAVNTFVGMALDLGHMTSRLGRATGGLSGPAIKPLALARCAETAAAVGIPVIGSGGIVSGRDALEFIAVGAAAVQVGTATFIRPRASLEILDEMAAFLAGRGLASLDAWRGCLALGGRACAAPAPAAAHELAERAR
uniref:Dihydroorotate dehydrogenase n=1 Tax=Eiseniibacteriota bacterium TaxID=2212470 RepID=A0A832I2I3_UNCEI